MNPAGETANATFAGWDTLNRNIRTSTKQHMSNIVAVVGRPNVGKSTLFNRLTGTRNAIIDETEGVTRDRHYGNVEWNGKEFTLIDTGGYIHQSDDIFEEEIRKQVMLAVEEADLILFVTDVTQGITPLDQEVADMLRRCKKPILLLVNKVDNNDRQFEAPVFHAMGLGDYMTLSAINGSGTGDILDKILELLPNIGPEEPTENLPRFAIVGRPNAGKSSLLNALIGEERNIVTSIAGTTRDSIFTRYNKYNHDFYLVDTAGLRKKTSFMDNVEFYSVTRAIKTIENSDVCLLMLDATRGVESQDMSILRVIQSNKKGLVILVNKWDLIEKETQTAKEFEQTIKQRLAPFTDVDILFVSALTKQRIHKVLEVAMEVYQNRNRRITTSQLNQDLLPLIENYPPPAWKGKYIKVKYVTQLPTPSPSFVFFCNLPQYVRDPYKRYLENRMREIYKFTGVPIQLYFRQK